VPAPSTTVPGPRLGDRAIELLPAGPPAFGASVDVEDWYHSNFRSAPLLDETALPHRVETGLDRILEAMDRQGARATFFVLGSVARENPHLVRRIAEAGHEVGCHGMHHALLYDQEPAAFKSAASDAHSLLCDLSAQPVLGFRAPSWSLTLRSLWAFDALHEAGFRYDSSVFPAANHLYGIRDAPRRPYRVATPAGFVVEIPPAAANLGPLRVGVGGGFYLRVLPLWFHKASMAAYARRGSPFVLYMHPRELDPGAWKFRLPLSFSDHLIHDWAIAHAPRKVEALLAAARWEPLGDILGRGGFLA
jgi:polysaccharide deacetylase family protein (PEP-CTERM system associated)